MLVGKWRNVEDLEESLNLEELKMLIDAKREQEHRHHKFLAAIQGIDIDADNKSGAEERFEEIRRRVESQLTGASEEQLELAVFGLDVESEDDEV